MAKLTKSEQVLVNKAAALFSDYMKDMTARAGKKRVYELFELDAIENMFCGGDYETNIKANEALKMLDDAWHEVCTHADARYRELVDEEREEAEDGQYFIKDGLFYIIGEGFAHEDCDQFGCGGDHMEEGVFRCPRQRIYNAIYRRLIAKFHIPELQIVWPLGLS